MHLLKRNVVVILNGEVDHVRHQIKVLRRKRYE